MEYRVLDVTQGRSLTEKRAGGWTPTLGCRNPTMQTNSAEKSDTEVLYAKRDGAMVPVARREVGR